MVAVALAPSAFKTTLNQRAVQRTSRANKVVVRAVSEKNVAQDVAVKTAAFASLATSFLAAGNAQAATEIANIAGGDGRASLLFIPLTAALGWVGIQIIGPFQNQLAAMSEKKRSIAAGLGLGAATLLAAQSADAATEIANIAGGDGRASLLFIPLTAALGWVGIQIIGPFQNQLAAMSEKKRSVAAGLGLGAATLLAAQSADAATEIANIAGGDGRSGLLFLPLLAALGWVLFNIAGPAKNQIDNMSK